jgi:hypothetical protein
MIADDEAGEQVSDAASEMALIDWVTRRVRDDGSAGDPPGHEPRWMKLLAPDDRAAWFRLRVEEACELQGRHEAAAQRVPTWRERLWS